MNTGEIIKKLRKENNLTQEELGEKLGLKKSAIRKYEKNEVENLKKTTIAKMCKIFNVSPSYLLALEELEETKNLVNLDELDLQPILHITNFVACCGNGIDFSELDDNQEIIYLPTDLVGTNTKNSWVMHTTGDSMNKIIPENSKIIVKQNEYYQNGDIVLYKVSNSFAIKEYYAYKDRIVLKPESYNLIHSQETYRYEDRDNGFEFPEILGKVTGFYGSTL